MDPTERVPSPRHRAAAFGALVCLLLAVLELTNVALRGMPEMLVPIGAGALAVWSGWRSLTRRGRRRRVYGGVATASAIATLVTAAIWTREFPGVVVAILLLVVAALLSSVALAWVHQPAGRLVGPARRPVLIVNPRSGDGTAERVGLVDAARRRGILVVELGPGDDLARIAARLCRSGTDVIGMAGGDGSLAIVADAAMEARIPFVCVPAGTRNHFALDLGLDRTDPVGSLDAFGEAVQRKVDVGVVNGRRFLNNVSLGAYGQVIASDEYRANKLGVALEQLPDLIGPEAEPLDLRFVDGSGTAHPSAVAVMVSNNSYELGANFGFGSRPSLIDAELGIVALVQDRELGPPRVLNWQQSVFRLESDAPVPSGIDGESVELTSPVEFRVEPLALRVRMPRSAAGVSPAAKRPSFTVRTLRRLWAVANGHVPADDVSRLGAGSGTGGGDGV